MPFHLRLKLLAALIAVAATAYGNGAAQAQTRRSLDLAGFTTGVTGDHLAQQIMRYRASLPGPSTGGVPPHARNREDTIERLSFTGQYDVGIESFEFSLDRSVPRQQLSAGTVIRVERRFSFVRVFKSYRDFVGELLEKFGADMDRFEDGQLYYLLLDASGRKRPVGRDRNNRPADRTCKFMDPEQIWGRSSALQDWSREPIGDCGLVVKCHLSPGKQGTTAAEIQAADAFGYLNQYVCSITDELAVRNGVIRQYRPPASTPGKL